MNAWIQWKRKRIIKREEKNQLPRLYAASVPGLKHEKKEEDCEDASTKATIDAETAVLVVADGVSSCRYGGKGARVAAAAAKEEIRIQLLDHPDPTKDPKRWMAALFAKVRRQLARSADRLGCGIQDMGTTLLVGIYQNPYWIVAQVGDGGIVAKKGTRFEVVLAGRPQQQENWVIPLTAPRWVEDIQVRMVENPDWIAMFSDGLDRLVFDCQPGKKILNENRTMIFEKIFDKADAVNGDQIIKQLLNVQSVDRLSSDDKSLAIAFRREGATG
jgi:hypothetical protein